MANINTNMKKILFLIICFLFISANSLAQTAETFDVATFKPPAGWKKQPTENAVQYMTEDAKTGASCIIMLTKSIPALGDSKANFAGGWENVVKGMVTVSTAPEMQPAEDRNGWETLSGYAPFELDGSKGVVILVTASGFEKMVNVVIFTNTNVYEKNIADFLASVSLKNPPVTAKQTPVANSDSNASVVGTWGISMVVAATMNTMAGGTAGSTIKQYTFNANGTYSFYIKTFSFSYENLLLTRETSTYQISGNNITVNPKESVVEAWSKKDGTDEWGRLLSTQKKELEKTTYRFTRRFSEGMKEWQLVLQAESVTKRDGPFNGGSALSNAWIYIPPCEKCFIELPR